MSFAHTPKPLDKKPFNGRTGIAYNGGRQKKL